MITRRDFLQTSAAVAAFSMTSPGGAAPFSSIDAEWFDLPMRWAQLNLTEEDVAKMDRTYWLDYFRRIHADALCLSAGGVVAFYPTKIKYHHRSQWLAGHEDFWHVMLEGCRKQNMVVLGRTDPHATYDDVKEVHPDWISVGPDGKMRLYPDYPGMWFTCTLGPYNLDFMTEVIQEIVELYDVDGIFANIWNGNAMCYCEHCRQGFRTAFNQDIPHDRDPRNPVYRNYLMWEQARRFEIWAKWDGVIRKVRPNARYIANSGGGATNALNMKKVGELAPTLFADRQGRDHVMAPWANGKYGKEYRSTLGNKAIVGIFNVGIVSPYRWLNSTKSAAETRLWVQDGMANGLRPWFNMFSGQLRDTRGQKVIEDLYIWHHKNERYFRNTAPLARVGLVYSQQTAEFYPEAADMHRLVEDPQLGMYQALIEARIPFEMVHELNLDAVDLNRFKTLILPNIAALSDQQCQQLRDFVQKGGSLVATYETSLCDEQGNPRKDFGLTDLFGASFVSRVNGKTPLQNTYLYPEKTSPFYGPLLKNITDAETVIGGTWQLNVKAHSEAVKQPLYRIPAVANLPMQKTFWTVDKTDAPDVFMNQVGEGRVVYFPWDIDRVYWEVMAYDHALLLVNSIEWATNEPHPLRVKGQGMFDSTLWLQKDSMTVHLVNLTNPMAMRPQMHELIASPPQTVEVEIPEGKRVAKVQALMKASAVQHIVTGSTLKFEVPSVLDYEVIAIDLV
jgi:Hypothetical glycosyl hydrolase 6/Beta-galactosidase trimerisation domain